MNNIPFCWPYLMLSPNMYNNKRRMQFGQVTKTNTATSNAVQNVKEVTFEENIAENLSKKEKEIPFVAEEVENVSGDEIVQETIEEPESNLPEVFQSKPQISYKLKL